MDMKIQQIQDGLVMMDLFLRQTIFKIVVIIKHFLMLLNLEIRLTNGDHMLND